MRKLLFMSIAVSFVACKKENKEEIVQNSKNDTVVVFDPNIDHHNSQNSLDWNGTYIATLPCADCPGILTTIVLNIDETFNIKLEYKDRNVITEDTGSIMWHNNGSVVHLKGNETDIKLKVIENGLIHLDEKGTEIKTDLKEHYRFKKL